MNLPITDEILNDAEERFTDDFRIMDLAKLLAELEYAKSILRSIASDDDFADLCAGIGDEPVWLKETRSYLHQEKDQHCMQVRGDKNDEGF